jgi:hypothetical protein
MKLVVESINIINKLYIYVLVEDNSREIIQSACRSIGSVKDNEFDVRFNPDLFQPHVILNQTVFKKYKILLYYFIFYLAG